jgi:hypothetical protein
VGHQDAFLRPRLKARYRFSRGTFARTHGNGRDAPIAVISVQPSGLGQPGRLPKPANRSCARYPEPESEKPIHLQMQMTLHVLHGHAG